jgi:hypothetical protein
MADITHFTIITYERRPGQWRAAVTPIRPSGIVIRGSTVMSLVTPDDFETEPEAEFAAQRLISKL